MRLKSIYRTLKESSDEQAFLNAIAADPEDSAPRLIFADWLDEHGDPRAEVYQ